MIVHSDITGVDEDVARRVIAVARSIAPIDSIEDGSEDHKSAISILQGVADELPKPGTRHIKSRARAGTSVTYQDVRSAFSPDDRDALRALCPPRAGGAGPVGSFPTDLPMSRMWPEGGYS